MEAVGMLLSEGNGGCWHAILPSLASIALCYKKDSGGAYAGGRGANNAGGRGGNNAGGRGANNLQYPPTT